MPKRSGPAWAGTAGGAGIGNAGQHSDTTQRTPPVDLSEIRFAHAVGRLHRLGARATFELLAELAAARMLRTEIEAMVERYVSDLDAGALAALGADRFPLLPLHAVERGDG